MNRDDADYFRLVSEASSDLKDFDSQEPVSLLRQVATRPTEQRKYIPQDAPPKRWRIQYDELRLLDLLPSETREQRAYKMRLVFRVANLESWEKRDALLIEALERANLLNDLVYQSWLEKVTRTGEIPSVSFTTIPERI